MQREMSKQKKDEQINFKIVKKKFKKSKNTGVVKKKNKTTVL
tara:strand:- start:454 stop:579 length:126 start_codon:yes stop_codon:yes gene_type:complete